MRRTTTTIASVQLKLFTGETPQFVPTITTSLNTATLSKIQTSQAQKLEATSKRTRTKYRVICETTKTLFLGLKDKKDFRQFRRGPAAGLEIEPAGEQTK